MKKRFNVAGWDGCSAYAQARNALVGLQAIFKDDISVNVHNCELGLPVLLFDVGLDVI